MKIWLISDTHGKHSFLDIPLDVDMLIHAGDLGTFKEPTLNAKGVQETIDWLVSLTHIKHKVFIAGNHDTSIERGYVSPLHKDLLYLKHEVGVIGGLKIFGSPYTPTFSTGWAYNVNRAKIDRYWQEIPEDIDILVTHGPPLGILDHTSCGINFTEEYGGKGVVSCGDSALLKRVMKIQPKLHVFGHIHNEERCKNAGIMQVTGCKTKFVNASVLDLDYKINNNGLIIEL